MQSRYRHGDHASTLAAQQLLLSVASRPEGVGTSPTLGSARAEAIGMLPPEGGTLTFQMTWRAQMPIMGSMPAPHANILFIFADQMHRFALGCMGTADIQTPNLDRLAQQGMLFRNAYSNCPVCTPFRINLFTGLYTCQTGTFRNEARIPAGCPTLADALNAGGYRTSFVGKWHIGDSGNKPIPRELRDGFTDVIGYQCYNGFNDNIRFYDEENREHAFGGHRTDVTTDLAIARLEALAQQPFALFVGYQAPHYPVQPAPEFEALYRGVTIQRRPNCREVDPYTRTFSPPSPWPPEPCPDFQRYGNDLNEYLRLYYALVTQIDANVGRLLAALERLGLAENTVVVFTADHGDMQASHGLKNKSLPQEESSGIPLIVRVPGGAAGVISDALVSGIDFYPTCLDYAGLAQRAGLPGTSFAPLTRGEPQQLTAPVFSEMPDWKMVRDRALKLVVEGADYTPTQLYDLESDLYGDDQPGESARVCAACDATASPHHRMAASVRHAIKPEYSWPSRLFRAGIQDCEAGRGCVRVPPACRKSSRWSLCSAEITPHGGLISVTERRSPSGVASRPEGVGNGSLSAACNVGATSGRDAARCSLPAARRGNAETE